MNFTKLPKVRMPKIDKIKEFAKRDKISTFDDLNANHAPSGYNYHKINGYIIVYEIIYDRGGQTYAIFEPHIIKINF